MVAADGDAGRDRPDPRRHAGVGRRTCPATRRSSPQAVDPVGWQLVVSALLLTIAAALALPADVRRESTVAGAALTTLAAPASLGLSWQARPWLLLAGAVGIGAAGLTARDAARQPRPPHRRRRSPACSRPARPPPAPG